MGPRAKAQGIARAREAYSDSSFSEASDAHSDSTETPRTTHVLRALPTPPPSEARLEPLDTDEIAGEGRHKNQDSESGSPTPRRPTLLRRRTPSTVLNEASLDLPDQDDAEPGAEDEDQSAEVECTTPRRPTLLLRRAPTPKLVSEATPVRSPSEASARHSKTQRSATDSVKKKHEGGSHDAQLYMRTDAAGQALATPSVLSEKPRLLKKKQAAQETTNEQTYDVTEKSWWLKMEDDLLASKIKAIVYIISSIFEAAKVAAIAGLGILSFGVLSCSLYSIYCNATSTGSYAHNFDDMCTFEAHPLVDCHVAPIGIADGPRDVACFLQRGEEEVETFRDHSSRPQPTFHWTSLYPGIRGHPHDKMPLTLLSLDMGFTVRKITDLIQEREARVKEQQLQNYDVFMATIRPDEIFSQLIQFDKVLGGGDAQPPNQTALRMKITRILELRTQHLKGLERLGSRLNTRLTRQGSSSTAGGAWLWMIEKRLDLLFREMFLELKFWESNETLVLGDLSKSVLSMANDEEFAQDLNVAVSDLIWIERKLELLIGDRDEEAGVLGEVMQLRKNLEDWKAFFSAYYSPSLSPPSAAQKDGRITIIGFLHPILHAAQRNNSTIRNEKRLIRTWADEKQSTDVDWSTADLCWNMLNKLEEEIRVMTELHGDKNNSTIQSLDLVVI